jgi:transcriptional regulator with XRE-family HTH domain
MGNVTLEAFAARVGCHFTTASRLRAGERMPGRELLGRIVEEFELDKAEAFKIYTAKDPAEFGEFLRTQVFEVPPAEDTEEVPHAGNAAA